MSDPHRGRIVTVLTFVVALAPGTAMAQASGVNPDISVIPSFLLCPRGEEDCAFPDADGVLNFEELEIALQGYLNPYVRGDVFVSVQEGGVEAEEAYATFLRGMGPFQAKLGKYRVDWGSVNPLHPHAYSWIFQPLVEERLFGPEGLNQIAANGNVSFPAGERGELKLSFDVMRGDFENVTRGTGGAATPGGTICVGPGCEDGLCQPGDTDCALVYYQPNDAGTADASPDPAYHLRVSWFDELRPSHSILVGASGLSGKLDPSIDRKVSWLGADFKYRWRPSTYRALNVFGSFVRNRADLEGSRTTSTTCVGPDCAANVCPPGGVCQELASTERIKGRRISTSGWYLIADCQFATRWNAGAKLDRAQGLESEDTIRRAEVFVNFRLMEESTLFRLLFRREDGDPYASAKNTTALQLVWSLGPHRPHSF